MEPEELNALAKILTSKIAEQTYTDGLKPVVVASGKIGGDLAKTARLLLAPIQYAAAIQDRFESYLERLRKKAGPKELVEPPKEIVVPVIENLKFHSEDSILTEMFLNILACAMDGERNNQAHPAFPKIISELAPDEALILYYLTKSDFEVEDHMDYDRGQNRFSNLQIRSSSIPKDKLRFPDNFELYYSHLQSLSLISWPVKKQTPVTDQTNQQTGIVRNSIVTLTDFGRLFCKACIPDEESIKPFIA